MNNDKHIISKQVLELSIPDNLEAISIQKKASEILRNKLFSELDNLFSNIVSNEEVLRIEKLEINIGDISLNNIEEDIVSKSIKTLETQLNKICYQHKQENLGYRTENNENIQSTYIKKSYSRLEQLVHFLKFGVFPWWKISNEKTSLEELLIEIKKENQPEASNILLELIKHEQIRKRIAYQFSNEQFLRILKLLQTNIESSLVNIYKELQLERLIKNKQISSIIKFHLLELIPIIEELKPQKTLNIFVEKVVTYITRFKTIKSRYVLLSTFEKHFITLNIESQQKLEILSLIKQAKSILKRDKNHGFSEQTKEQAKEQTKEKINDNLNENMLEQDSILNSQMQEKQLQSEPLDSTQNDTGDIENSRESTKQGSEQLDINSSLVKKNLKGKKVDTISQPFKLNRDEEIFYIENAGLVLLNPYLFYFFDGLGLLDSERKFNSEDAAFRGVHLLQYLVTEETATPEQDLILNKILCGLEISQPVPFDVELSKYEIEECIILLETVTTRWEALKTKDTNAVRSNFLNREGKLSYAGNGWNIYIERDTLDLLLDKLPWPISIIRQPWIKEIIYVEW